MKVKQILKTAFGSLIGAALFGSGSYILWYFAGYYFYNGGFFSRTTSSEIAAVIGGILGAIGGSLAGGIIIGGRAGKLTSFMTGSFLNGIIPFLAFVFFSETDFNFFAAPNDLKYSLLGQFITGGISGIVLFLVSRLAAFKR